MNHFTYTLLLSSPYSILFLTSFQSLPPYLSAMYLDTFFSFLNNSYTVTKGWTELFLFGRLIVLNWVIKNANPHCVFVLICTSSYIVTIPSFLSPFISKSLRCIQMITDVSVFTTCIVFGIQNRYV